MRRAVLLLSLCFIPAEAGAAESWYCSIKDKDSSVRIQEFRIVGNVMREPLPTGMVDPFVEYHVPGADKDALLGAKYNILQNDKNDLIEAAFYSGFDSDKHLEISINNVIITKSSGDLIYNRVITPNKTETLFGSCTKALSGNYRFVSYRFGRIV
jgi:hypothetical protein